jgi:hypothetical protein
MDQWRKPLACRALTDASVSSADTPYDKQMPQGRSTCVHVDTTTGHGRQRTLLGVVGQSWADLVFAQHSQRRNAKRILLCARCRRHHAHPANTACSEAQIHVWCH